MKNQKYSEQFDYLRQTPFHWAAKLGYEKILNLLLQYSYKCNVYDKKLRTPLYLAALNNQKKCVELLVENGGNPYLVDKDGKRPEEVTTDLDIRIYLQTTTEKPFNEIYAKQKEKNEKDGKNETKENSLSKSIKK